MSLSKKLSADDFFDSLAPKVMERRRELCAKIGGIYLFELTGGQDETWCLDFGKGTIARTVAETPSFRMRISAENFEQWLSGKLDVARALETRAIEFFGDTSALINFSIVFQP